MKKMTLLRSMATVALFTVVGMGAFAQVTGTGTMVPTGASPQDVDYVTVNSTMPYQVTAFDWGTLSGVLGSAFKWSVSADGTIAKTDGSALTQVGSTGYYNENSIGIKWTAIGTKTLTLTEIGRNIGFNTVTSCPGTDVTLPVNVLARPKVDWGTFTDPSGCSISGGAASVPVVCSGSQTITVNYHVTFTPLVVDGTHPVVNNDVQATISAGGYDKTAVAGNLNVPAVTPGKYEVSITGVFDTVSEKSFSVSAAGSTDRIGTVAVDYPAAASTKVFYLYPTPTTAPIQHIQNL